MLTDLGQKAPFASLLRHGHLTTDTVVFEGRSHISLGSKEPLSLSIGLNATSQVDESLSG